MLASSIILMVGCQSNISISETGSDVQAQPSKQGATVDEQMIRRGKLMFLKCRACHSLTEDGGHQTGPNLYGLFGATVGKKEGFVYSEALTASNAVWSEETLDQFLKKPTEYLPGTKMAFIGMPKDTNRQALIAYLRKMTQ